ncbi:MAG: phosphate ABC transporter permease subunit PstC [Acidimicrobiia bacterium]|nr:phosphate ABC transporter permease subunit PstC [Acidimicrobiia bacterium]MYH05673.1 phosphate ABC transporter permease subunit PstC [Acidimicrobiia bacterium]MYK55609.1 phosphate ABC transporter permease subunit PstC [Acidimicrobiia bacterium]
MKVLETSAQPDLFGDPRRLRRERNVRRLFLSAAVFTVLVSVAIVLSLVGEAVAFLQSIASDIDEGLGSLNADGWFPRRDRFDLRTIIWHTLSVSIIAMSVAAPLGLGAAVYLSEYAKPGVRRVLKPVLEILAGIPSVVLGYFALRFITPDILRNLWDATQQSNLMAAGIGVGILIIPLVSSVSEDAMQAVPRALRDASYGLGAKKWHTSLRVVFPAALSGIVAALILGLSRAIGETMVVAIAAGATGGSLLQLNPLNGGQTMTGAMASLAIGSDQVAGGVAAFQSLFFVGLLLFLMTLVLNMGSERLVRRFRQRY